MKEPLIWSYLIHLSTHMWDDETTVPSQWYMSPSYTDTINTEIEVWDKTVRFLGERKFNLVLIDVGDGLQYETHPEVSAPNAWSKDLLKKKLAEMRALGLEPIPKLNFSAGHDTWMKHFRRKISTPEYYAFCADLIREVCEVFDFPRFFHLGCDEEIASMQSKYEIITIRGKELWWHDLYFLFKECEKHGARPWVWSDYLWKNEASFLENMPKSVIQSNWYYQPFQDWSGSIYAHRNRPIAAYEILEKHGYDQIPCGSTWNCIENLYQTMAHGRATLSDEHIVGYLTAPWLSTREEDFYGLCCDADRFYVARKKVYPETL